LKPERWGSPLVQEKYRGEKVCDRRQPYRIIIIKIIVKSNIRLFKVQDVKGLKPGNKIKPVTITITLNLSVPDHTYIVICFSWPPHIDPINHVTGESDTQPGCGCCDRSLSLLVGMLVPGSWHQINRA
jgi:hypothetical protein